MENVVTNYSESLIREYARPAPRYTSYPTAPHFSENIQHAQVRSWMMGIPEQGGISIYIHIPFCDRLCWFCGCHTKHTLKYEPVKNYLQTLYAEMRLTAQIIGRRQNIRHLHLGGGSPSLLKAPELEELKAVLNECFTFSTETEISLEFDPTDLDSASLKAFAKFGITRASLGVQDFDPRVQQSINRIQTFEQTKFVVDTLRDYGVTSLNIDALYGLPYQSLETLERTLVYVDALQPDRIALFGYAHVPWVKPHQKLIPDDSLPNNILRFKQARLAEGFFETKGYTAIGIDHFAKPTDSLAVAYRHQTVRRNFQGYTTDDCDTLIGFGVSSISQYPQGYSQNVKDTHSYKRAVEGGSLPIQRGFAIGAMDITTASAINELMCYFTLTSDRLRRSFGDRADLILTRAERLASEDMHGFFVKDGADFKITERGKPFTRTLTSAFDEYLKNNETRYSIAV
ncbi:oxygen-independent coproporphyrinogen III oxidase [Robiginitomaculum antarcticum]|uniref:oxygen-independent coproporphyrinogen III oxidase n=1 Tax=Robiginitomaculum antarcticum TaxID=437507 RepID=UPI00039F7597|nr:oxygen-independent coproporphyrinogen III oxidase [Robiginitomaculum antarcticum]